MHIYIDADACPVVRITENIAKSHHIPVTILCDTNHVLTSDYSEVKIIGAGADAVDFALIGLCKKGDIVVTQDYGVAAMALGKGAFGIHQSGRWYTDENIDRLLMERHMAKKARRASGKHHLKGPAKRTPEDDERFARSLENLIEKCKVRKKIEVAAAIIRQDHQIFATQRGYGDFKDYWEFPGGKIEPGESPKQALVREIREELDTEIEVGELFEIVEYEYPQFHLTMHCFWCTVKSGRLVLKEHEAAKWLKREELDSVEWLPADIELVAKLKEALAEAE